MKKIICVFVSVFLCACAGNPPAWWNPSGRYMQNTQPNTTAAPTSIPATITPQKQSLATPAEETFTPEESSFEEMALTPPAVESLENAEETLQPSILEE